MKDKDFELEMEYTLSTDRCPCGEGEEVVNINELNSSICKSCGLTCVKSINEVGIDGNLMLKSYMKSDLVPELYKDVAMLDGNGEFWSPFFFSNKNLIMFLDGSNKEECKWRICPIEDGRANFEKSILYPYHFFEEACASIGLSLDKV